MEIVCTGPSYATILTCIKQCYPLPGNMYDAKKKKTFRTFKVKYPVSAATLNCVPIHSIEIYAKSHQDVILLLLLICM